MNDATKITVGHHGENGMGNKRMSSHLRQPDKILRGRGVDLPFLAHLEASTPA
jgi:hypothetical protein